MARYELKLKLDGALWLTIIFKPLLNPKRAISIQFESYVWLFVTEKVFMIWNVTAKCSNGACSSGSWSVAKGPQKICAGIKPQVLC